LQFLEDDLAPVLRRTTEWAVTGWAGAAFLAPSMTFTPAIHLYVAGADFGALVESVFQEVRIRPVDNGSNVEFLSAQKPLLLFTGAGKSVRVVNPPRLYADLMALGGRGEDAARTVRESVIGY
jgi:hypothetical protein